MAFRTIYHNNGVKHRQCPYCTTIIKDIRNKFKTSAGKRLYEHILKKHNTKKQNHPRKIFINTGIMDLAFNNYFNQSFYFRFNLLRREYFTLDKKFIKE